MLVEFLNLGRQPIANGFLKQEDFDKEFFYSLRVGFDPDTQQLSLLELPKAEQMFNGGYVYRSSGSATMVEHFKEAALTLVEKDDANVLEIGSNDGVFIRNIPKHLGVCVEPCDNFASFTERMGYTTYNNFWDTKTAEKILRNHSRFDYIFSANCMCHIPDLDEAFRAIDMVLAEDGIFCFQDPCLQSMLEIGSYDQIYDEHAHIFSPYYIRHVTRKHGLKIFRIRHFPDIHGGSNRYYVCKAKNVDYPETDVFDKKYSLGDMIAWGLSIKGNTDNLVKELQHYKLMGKKIIAIGATSKSTTVYNYAGIGPDLIEYITDSTTEKQGLFSPGTHIPIVSPEKGLDKSVDVVYLGAWNFKKEIMAKYRYQLRDDVKYITHVESKDNIYR